MSETSERVAGALSDLRGGGRGWMLATIAAGWLLTLGMRFLVPAVLPQVRKTFEISNATAGLAVTVIWAFYALTQFPAGLVTDRVGERTALAVSLGVTAGSLLLLAGAPLFPVFVLGAAAFGVSSGLYGPARGTSLSKGFPRRSGAAFGITLACGSLGSAVLPLVAGVLVGALGWRLLIAAAAPLFALCAAAAWVVLPHPIDALTDGPAQDDGPALSVRDAVRGLPAAVRNRNVVLAVLGTTFYLFAFQGLTAFLPTYLVEHELIGQDVAAVIFALLFVGGGLTQLVAGSLADRYGNSSVLVTVAVVGVLTLFVVPFVSSIYVWGVLSFLLGTRMGIAPVANSYIIATLPDEAQGASWGFVRTCFFLVGATGSVFVGAMADAHLFTEAFVALGAITAVAVVCFRAVSE